MADNFVADAGSGGDTFGADDISGVKFPRSKLIHGADGTNDGDVSTANPLPVELTDNNNTVVANILTLAGAVSGTEMQCDIVASLPAGTNAIGKLAANSGVDIGDVDILSVVPGTAATNLGKAEDAGHTTGDVGVMALAVRHTADTPLSGTDLDYEPLQTDENGYLKVNIKAGAAAGGTSTTDDAAFTAGSGSGTPIMGFATSDTVDAGDVGVVAMDVDRNLKVTVNTVVPGTAATNLGKAEDAVHTTGDTGVMMLGVRNDIIESLVGTDGDYAPLQVSAKGALYTTPGNFISTNNSTTTPLAADAVYTGSADDCHDYSGVTVLIDASHDSATDGISIQFSSDGTNWDDVRVYTFDVSETPSWVATLPVYARYFRLVYTNGGTLQTHFRVQSILHSNLVLQPSKRLSDNESPELSGVLTKSVLIAQNAGTGSFSPIQSTTGGNLKVSLDEVSNGMDVGAGNAGTETLRISISTDDVNLSAIKTAVETTATDTTSIDGKITACNTGAVVVASGAITETNSTAILADTASMDTNLGTIAGDTTSIDGKITACNTGAVVVASGAITETNSTAILADTAAIDTNCATIAGDTTSIDGKITACNTGAVVVASGAITETNSTAILADTASMDTNLGTVAGAVSGTEMQVDVVAALPAGTNAIGKLAANSGVDIGDVDVTSLPASIQGPGNPTIDSYSHVAINLTTGADQVLVSSAASKQIWVYGYGFTCGDADGQTVSLQDEDDTAVTGIMEFAQYGGISVPPSGNFAMPVFKLGTDKDLEIDITGGDVDGWLAYAIVSV